MDILLLGSSAKEHALAWKFAESRKTGTIYTSSPYAGVDTLADSWQDRADAWRAAHPDGLVLGERDGFRYPEDSAKPAKKCVSLPCLYDGKTVLTLPAVQIQQEDAVYSAFAPAQNMTQAMIEDVLSRIVLPWLQAQEERGVFCFSFSDDADLQLLSIHYGFGEMEAMAVLPMLRGELAGLLLACENGTLHSMTVPLNGTATAVYPYHTEIGAPLSGLSRIAMNTGFFIGAAEKKEDQLYALDPYPLYLCGRASTLDDAMRAADTARSILAEIHQTK